MKHILPVAIATLLVYPIYGADESADLQRKEHMQPSMCVRNMGPAKEYLDSLPRAFSVGGNEDPTQKTPVKPRYRKVLPDETPPPEDIVIPTVVTERAEDVVTPPTGLVRAETYHEGEAFDINETPQAYVPPTPAPKRAPRRGVVDVIEVPAMPLTHPSPMNDGQMDVHE